MINWYVDRCLFRLLLDLSLLLHSYCMASASSHLILTQNSSDDRSMLMFCFKIINGLANEWRYSLIVRVYLDLNRICTNHSFKTNLLHSIIYRPIIKDSLLTCKNNCVNDLDLIKYQNDIRMSHHCVIFFGGKKITLDYDHKVLHKWLT